jgi:hypothetical protein
VSGSFSEQSFTMRETGAGFLARQECGSQLNCFRTQSECGDYPSRISDSARSDYRHIGDIDDLRDQ